MAGYVHFFRISPRDYWALEPDELNALGRYMQQWHDAERQQQRG